MAATPDSGGLISTRRTSFSKQLKTDLDYYTHAHRLAVFQTRFKPPMLHRLDCLLIEAQSQALNDLDILRLAIFVDHQRQHCRAQ